MDLRQMEAEILGTLRMEQLEVIIVVVVILQLTHLYIYYIDHTDTWRNDENMMLDEDSLSDTCHI